MRMATLAPAMSMIFALAGCAHTVYFAPSGPGKTYVGAGGAPNIRAVKIGSGSTALVWIELGPGVQKLIYFLQLKATSVQLRSPDLNVRCSGAEPADLHVDRVSASGVLNGTMSWPELPWRTPLTGPGSLLPDGTVADGRYWIKVNLPACKSQTYMVHLPDLAGAEVMLPADAITFRRTEGDFVPFEEVM